MARPDVKVFHALGELHMIGKTESSKRLISVMAGYSNPTSSSFVKAIKNLRSQGYVESGSGANLGLTQKGLDALPPSISAPDGNDDVHERLLAIVSGKSGPSAKLRAMWNILSDGQSHTIEDLARALGYTNKGSSSFQRPISKMKELGILTRSNGTVKLTDLAFPFGPP